MAIQRFIFLCSILAFALQSCPSPGEARNITLTNKCDYMVWPVIKGTMQPKNTTGFSLKEGESRTMDVAPNWSAQVWGRTLCSTNSTGKFSCQTGDCGSGKIDCSDSKFDRNITRTLAEFTLQSSGDIPDYYDVSLVDGFNIPMSMAPQGGSKTDCSATGCPVDLNSECPEELRIIYQNQINQKKNQNHSYTIACTSACYAFGTPEYCCANSSTTCPASNYLLFFARTCPQAVSYAFDDSTTIQSCTSSPGYTITFCPSQASAPTSGSPKAPTPGPGDRQRTSGPSLTPEPGKKVNLSKVLAISISVFVSILILLGTIGLYIAKKRAKKRDASIFERADGDDYTVESLQCSLGALQAATNNFSDDNMIGKGGFGVVYKGTLPNGKQIAVKKLLSNTGKVEEEFKNEMKVVAKLQHRNLVGLLAFCLAGGERLLVFEYVPNKSLDYFIFEAERQRQLDWSSRFKIIVGIARGLLYLHEDSRLRIIHRDLKPSNILLDSEMNPKIADFGMARIFGKNQTPNNTTEVKGTMQQVLGEDQTHQSTNKAGGTLGYMAPEYVQTRRFSVKTDVYSFGVIILEIISGMRNSTFYRSGMAEDLLSYAWKQWSLGTPLELMDATLRDSYLENEVIRCIQLGLLCVQKDPNARPTMANIVHIMLNISSTDALPMPQAPAYFAVDGSDHSTSDSASERLINPSLNNVSISEMYPR